MAKKKISVRPKMLEFIDQYFVEHCRMPSIREIQSATRTSSTSMVAYHINALMTDGKLIRTGKGARNLAPAWLPDALKAAREAQLSQ
jgi:SOS-response transcriptional repressor LexA